MASCGPVRVYWDHVQHYVGRQLDGHSDFPGRELRRSASASGGSRAGAARRTGRGTLRHLLGILGPGLVTGAADDDPSGIATYSQTGAQFGYGQLWTALWMLPLDR